MKYRLGTVSKIFYWRVKSHLFKSAAVKFLSLLTNASIEDLYQTAYIGTNCEARSDCFYRSNLIWVFIFCQKGDLTIQETIKTNNFCCDWRFKGEYSPYEE